VDVDPYVDGDVLDRSVGGLVRAKIGLVISDHTDSEWHRKTPSGDGRSIVGK
jgi:hypothetical protein